MFESHVAMDTDTMMMLNIGADLQHWQIVINHVIADAICSLVPPAFSIFCPLQGYDCEYMTVTSTAYSRLYQKYFVILTLLMYTSSRSAQHLICKNADVNLRYHALLNLVLNTS